MGRIEDLFNVNENKGDNVIPFNQPESNKNEIDLGDEISKWKKANAEIKNLERRIKLLKQEKDAAAQKIKNSGLIKPNEPFLYMDHEVKWTKYPVERLDTKKLKAERPDIFNEYKTVSEQERFTIS